MKLLMGPACQGVISWTQLLRAIGGLQKARAQRKQSALLGCHQGSRLWGSGRMRNRIVVKLGRGQHGEKGTLVDRRAWTKEGRLERQT